jgi:uncharacterized protein YceK
MGRPLLRLLLLAPLACSGCFTILTWEAAPELHPARLLGAGLDDHGELLLRVELSDGSRHAYRGSRDLIGWVKMAPLDEASAAGSPEWRFLPMRDDGRIEIPGTYAGAPEGRPVVAVIDSQAVPLIEIAEIDGIPVLAHVSLPEDGATNWTHPGTWLCVVATPVTVAVDTVLLPFQLLLFFVLGPKC